MLVSRNVKVLAALVSALMLSSCSVFRSDYERSDAVVFPSNWDGDQNFQSVMRNPEGAWWVDFNDQDLTAVINLGIENSNKIKIAAYDLQKYALMADLADTNLLPTPSAKLSSGQSWNHNNTKTKSSSASLGVSYEVDLFGKLKAERDVSRFAYEASKEDYLSIKLALTYQIAQLYWQIGYYNDALKFEEENTADYEKIIKLAELRYKEGQISLYDFNLTKEQYLTTKNNVILYRDQLLTSSNALLSLLSVNDVKDLPIDLSKISLADKIVPEVVPGIPADILSNRPDIASAEFNLKSKLASYDVKRLSFFPTFSLTGTLGTGSDELFQFFDNPMASIIGALTAPFLNYETLSLNRDVSKVEYEKAVLEFETALREALFEVKELLVTIHGGKEQLLNGEERVKLAKANDENFILRYDVGDMSYNDFLTNKKTLRSSMLSYYKLKENQLENTANLYKALGGTQK